MLFFVIRASLRLIHLFFDAVRRGTVKLTGFDPEWSQATYRIVRLADRNATSSDSPPLDQERRAGDTEFSNPQQSCRQLQLACPKPWAHSAHRGWHRLRHAVAPG
jgi:hypothetical protein